MAWLFKLLRNTTFIVVLLGSLLTSTISLGIWAATLTTQVAGLTAGAAATAIANRKAIASAVATTRAKLFVKRKKAVGRAILRTKAKARLRRVMVAVPLAGVAAAAAFERQDYLEWKKENPNGDLNAYSCEVAQLSGEVVESVLQDLPSAVRPAPQTILSRLPTCEKDTIKTASASKMGK